jgi:hypothetical protein
LFFDFDIVADFGSARWTFTTALYICRLEFLVPSDAFKALTTH